MVLQLLQYIIVLLILSNSNMYDKHDDTNNTINTN